MTSSNGASSGLIEGLSVAKYASDAEVRAGQHGERDRSF